MCTYNVNIDDCVIERVKPHFEGTVAMQMWIEQLLQYSLVDYAKQYEQASRQDQRRRNLLAKLKTVKNDPDGFFKLAGILGKPKSDFSWEQLRDEVVGEKYHI